MKINKYLFPVVLVVLIAVLVVGYYTNEVVFAKSTIGHELTGKVEIVLNIPKEEMENLSHDNKMKLNDQNYGRFIELSDGNGKIVLNPPNWEVGVGDMKVLIDKNGHFHIKNIYENEVDVVLYFNNIEMIRRKWNFKEDGHHILLTIEKDVSQIAKKMSHSTNHRNTDSEVNTTAYIPCLDDNGGDDCKGFLLSDCYYALVTFAQPWCWQEAIMDTETNKWCNGTRNCSPNIGHSQWHHCH
ncbi:hypothetical protein JCM14720_15700 [Calditerricola yamamurae]